VSDVDAWWYRHTGYINRIREAASRIEQVAASLPRHSSLSQQRELYQAMQWHIQILVETADMLEAELRQPL